MKKITFIILILAFVSSVHADDFKLKLKEIKLKNRSDEFSLKSNYEPLQLKKRKAVSTYFGAGYTFVIFTDREMNQAYPVMNISNGEFLTTINLFFGFSIASALTLEFEPGIITTSNQRIIHYQLDTPKTIGGITYRYSHPQNLSLLAFPLAVNFRYFPLKAQTGFTRLFFIGAGVGAIWLREEYDNYYNNFVGGPQYNEQYAYSTESTSQWQPIFRGLIGFSGSGGQFGMGGELRYNYIPSTKSNEPFASRKASNLNSVDLSLRFYFSL